MLLSVFFGVKGLGCLRPCEITGFLHGGFPDILEGIQITPALDLFLFEKDMGINAGEHTIEGQHVIFRYAAVIALDRCEEVQLRAFLEFLLDLAGREAFIRNYDAFPDIIVTDESWVGACVNAVAGEHFRTDRFHELNVIGIQDGHITAALDPCLIGKIRQVVHPAGVLLQSTVNSDMVVFCHLCKTALIEHFSLGAILSDPLKEAADGVL